MEDRRVTEVEGAGEECGEAGLHPSERFLGNAVDGEVIVGVQLLPIDGFDVVERAIEGALVASEYVKAASGQPEREECGYD
jgi:hypothetical protein